MATADDVGVAASSTHENWPVRQRPVTLDEIRELLETHAAQEPERKIRLALVMTGGGAKCAFQLGVLGALEQELQRWRDSDSLQDVDFDLAVGVSGGALNALPVATGATASPEGFQEAVQVWTSVQKQALLRGSRLNAVLSAAWLIVLQILLARGVCVLFGRCSLTLLAVIGAAIAGAGCIAFGVFDPAAAWAAGPGATVLAATLLAGAFWASAAVLAGMTALLLALQTPFGRKQRPALHRRRWVRRLIDLRTLVLIVFLILAAEGASVLLLQDVIFPRSELKSMVAESLAAALPEETWRRISFETTSTADDDARSRALSEALVAETARRRADLAIAATCLDYKRQLLPSEFYFLLPEEKDASQPLPSGPRHVNLAAPGGPSVLDAATASAAIFPLLPIQPVEGVVDGEKPLSFVDGGFAQADPIDLAIRWGATHVIVIYVSPEATDSPGPSLKTFRRAESNVLENLADAARYLYTAAQITRREVAGPTVIIVARPHRENIGLLNFEPRAVTEAMLAGFTSAYGGMEADRLHGPYFEVLQNAAEAAGLQAAQPKSVAAKPIFVRLLPQPK